MLRIPYRPNATGSQLAETIQDLVEQISGGGAESVLFVGVVLATGLNRVRHFMRSTPRGWLATPYSGAMPTRPQAPDREFVFVQAAAGQTVDLLIVP